MKVSLDIRTIINRFPTTPAIKTNGETYFHSLSSIESNREDAGSKSSNDDDVENSNDEDVAICWDTKSYIVDELLIFILLKIVCKLDVIELELSALETSGKLTGCDDVFQKLFGNWEGATGCKNAIVNTLNLIHYLKLQTVPLLFIFKNCI